MASPEQSRYQRMKEKAQKGSDAIQRVAHETTVYVKDRYSLLAAGGLGSAAAATNGETSNLLLYGAAIFVLNDLSRRKSQADQIKKDAMSEERVWQQLQEEAAESGTPLPRRKYEDKIALGPHSLTFSYRDKEDQRKAKDMMRETTRAIINHPDAQRTGLPLIPGTTTPMDQLPPGVQQDSRSYNVNLGQESNIHLKTVVKDSQLVSSEIEFHGYEKNQYVYRHLSWSNKGARISAIEVRTDHENHRTFHRSFTIEEVTALQQDILSKLPPTTNK